MESVVGVADLTATPAPADADTGQCTYAAGDRAVAYVFYSASGGAADLAAFAGRSVPVADLGDAAIWVQSVPLLLIQVGDRSVGIQLLPTLVPPEELQSRSTILGRSAIDHL